MLSRTADHLFWMARYMERAENTARMLDVNYQTALLPQSAAVAEQGWQGLLSISELTQDYTERYGAINPRQVMSFMVKDERNASSILSRGYVWESRRSKGQRVRLRTRKSSARGITQGSYMMTPTIRLAPHTS